MKLDIKPYSNTPLTTTDCQNPLLRPIITLLFQLPSFVRIIFHFIQSSVILN